MVGVRMTKSLQSDIQRWAAKQSDRPSLAEAIRRLLELGLSPAHQRQVGIHKGASKAKSMAGNEIDRLADSSATNEQREKRKRRLLKGPTEFRNMRGDLPKKRR